MLVTTVVAGGITILHPFMAASRPFLRDIAFYMVAVFLTFTALYLGRITLAWALGEQSGAVQSLEVSGDREVDLIQSDKLYSSQQRWNLETFRPDCHPRVLTVNSVNSD